MPRRGLAALVVGTIVAGLDRPAPAVPNLAAPNMAAPNLAALHNTLPPGLHPRAIGAAVRAAHPACTAADCLAQADLANLATLPDRARADFAAGNTLSVDGWVLSRTEAWLCAALA